jgi:thiosulfate/3-mercaptopyruvate sulfurtransferase
LGSDRKGFKIDGKKEEKRGGESMKFVKSVDWLRENLTNRNIRVIDCTFSLQNPSFGKEQYGKSHIPGAVYFDLEKDLSGVVKKHGGRHPLPNMKNFLRKVEEAGIDEKSIVIVYDSGDGAFAARCWWLFTYIGHEKVYVLDGGFAKWVESDFPVTSEKMEMQRSSYVPHFREELLADIEEVKQVVTGDTLGVLIDSRAEKRYLGQEEPIDRIPGHIPTAQNFVWTEGLEKGLYKNKQEQKHRFQHLKEETPLIVYCGSGVTAAPNVLTLLEAGFQHVKLYVGSYSDWVSYEELPVQKET